MTAMSVPLNLFSKLDLMLERYKPLDAFTAI